jgi:hypothetical protein
VIDASAWPKWTSSVENRPATAEEVLGGMRGAAVAADLNRVGNKGQVAA